MNFIPTCKKCGAQVPTDAEFCPECGARIMGTSVETPARKHHVMETKRGFRIAGGVLTIIGSGILLLSGIGGISPPTVSTLGGLTIGLVGLFTFVLGLVGGILTLVKKVFPLAIIGEVFVLVGGVLASIPVQVGYGTSSNFLVLSIPIIILAIFGIVFTAAAKCDFK